MFQPQIPLTDQTKILQKKLYTLIFIGITLAFLKFFTIPAISSLAFSEIINYSILICSAICLNYCLLVFFVIFQLFTFLSILLILGIEIQEQIVLGKSDFLNFSSKSIFSLFVVFVTIFFYVYLFFECLKIYRVFKKMFLGGSSVGTGLLSGRQGRQGERREEERDVRENDRFAGPGIVIGGN